MSLNRPAIIGLLVGIPVLFSPMPVKLRIFISGSALSGSAIAFLYQKSGQAAINESIDRKQKQLKEKEQQLAKLKLEIDSERDNNLKVIENLKQSIDDEKATFEHRKWLELEQIDTEKEIKLKSLEQRLAAEKEAFTKRCDRELAAIQELEESSRIEIAGIRKRAALAIKKARQKWQKHKDISLVKYQQEIDKSVGEVSQELIEEYEKERNLMVKELNELRSQLTQEAEEKYRNWLIPHCQEMDSLLREIESLKSTVVMLKEQMASDRDIKLSGARGTVHGDRADLVLRFLKDRGVYCDYESAIVQPDGTFVLNFIPWEFGGKAEKKIKGLLLALQVEFGCPNVPTFQPNGMARAWTLTMSYGSIAAPLSQYYQPVLETLVSSKFQDIEPIIKDGVARQLSRQERIQEMRFFIPPVPLPRPTSWQISEIELQCFEWFYSWRSFATEGKEPNATTQEELLWYIYGIRKGRASVAFDEVINESLGDRVNRILSILRSQEANELS